MNKLGILFVGICCLVPFSKAQFSSFDFYRPLRHVEESSWYKIPLPQEVLAKLNDRTDDFRLYELGESDTLETPFLKEIDIQAKTAEHVPCRILTRKERTEGAFVVFRVPYDLENEFIELEFEEKNFDYNIWIQGSNNRIKWNDVAKDIRLIGYEKAGISYAKTKIPFAKTSFRFLKLWTDVPTSSITKVSMGKEEMDPGNYESFRLGEWEAVQDVEKKRTELVVPLLDRAPVGWLELSIDNQQDYFRNMQIDYLAEVLSTDAGEKEVWRPFGRFVLTSWEAAHFPLPMRMTEKIRIQIENQDNRPLPVKGIVVKGPLFHLLAQLEGEKNYALAYGSNDMMAPNYDLIHFRDSIPEDLSNIFLSDEIPLTKEEVEREIPSQQYMIWGILILVVLVLGAFALSMLRKAKNT